MDWLIAGSLLVVVIVLLYVRQRRAAEPASRPERRRQTAGGSFHAVSIRFGPGACSAAKALAGERFLSAEAPQLPLPECDAANCECRFAHHGDRRSGKDRRSPFGSGGSAAATGNFEQERRSGGERRDEPEDDWR